MPKFINIAPQQVIVRKAPSRFPSDIAWTTPAGLLASPFEQTAYSIQLSATDSQNLPLSYILTSGVLPGSLILSVSGLLSGNLPASHVDTSATFEVTVTNGLDPTVARTFSLGIKTNNTAPVWSTATGTLGSFPMRSPASVTLLAVDAQGDGITYSISSGSLPSGMSLNGATGVISGTPAPVASDQTSTFTVAATDQYGAASTRQFSMVTQFVNIAPVWTTATGSLGSLTMNVAVTPFSIAATDADGDTLQYAVTAGALPPGVTMSASGAFSGRPTSVSSDTTFSFTVTASDGKGGSTTRAFSIEVKFVNVAPVWNAGTPTSIKIGTPYSYTLPVTDADNAPQALTVSVKTGALPAGLTLSGKVISGTATTPATPYVGNKFSIEFEASDGLAAVSKSFEIEITNAEMKWLGTTGTGRIYTSDDGLAWSQVKNPSAPFPTQISGHKNYAVISTSTTNTLLTSGDGTNFASQASGTAGAVSGVAYGNGMFVAIGTSIARSTDGINFTATLAQACSQICFGGGKFIAFKSNASYDSTDGVNWNTNSFAIGSWTRTRYLNGQFFQVSSGGAIRSSPDGITWTNRASSVSRAITDIAYGNGLYVAVGFSGLTRTSTDGITWTGNVTNTTTGNRSMSSIHYYGGLWVVGHNQGISTSTDGASFSEVYTNSGSVNDLIRFA